MRKEVLVLCNNMIRAHLGSLDDLPYELANTIANVYYKFFEMGMDIEEDAKNNPGWIPRSVKKASNFKSGLAKFLEDYVRLKSDVESVPSFISALRKINKKEEPSLYDYWVNFIIDCLKYDIKHPEKKTELRRMIERKFKKVNEIPKLIDLLDVYGS